MGEYIVDRLVKLMAQRRINVVDSRVLVLGLAFKENCPDIRNTRVVDVVEALKSYNVQVDVHDPWVDPQAATSEYNIQLITSPSSNSYDAVVLAVAHDEFLTLGSTGIKTFLKPEHVLFDVKGVLPRAEVTARL